MSNKETRAIIRKEAVNTETAPRIDPTVVATYAERALEETKETEYPPLQEFIEARHTLKPENYSEGVKDIIRLMDGYHEAMKNGKNPTLQQQGVQVGKLSLAFNRALRGSDAVLLMDIILWYFGNYANDTFRGDRPYRAVNMYAFGSHEALTFFTHMVAISQTLADYEERHKLIRRLDFKAAIDNIPKGFEQQRAGMAAVIAHYSNF